MKSPIKDKGIRFWYGLFFAVLWLAGMYYGLWFMPTVYNSGSATITLEQMIPYDSHGKIVYLTPRQHFQEEFYGLTIAFLLATWFILGIVLQRVYKIKIFGY